MQSYIARDLREIHLWPLQNMLSEWYFSARWADVRGKNATLCMFSLKESAQSNMLVFGMLHEKAPRPFLSWTITFCAFLLFSKRIDPRQHFTEESHFAWSRSYSCGEHFTLMGEYK